MRSGDRIGHLVIERELGAGGMGQVFLARDERLQRQVAVKLLPIERAADRTARLRMLREARSASALQHPGIVTVYDVGEHDGRAFIAMEFVEGETLDRFLDRRGKLPPAEAVELLAAFGDAVSAAHDAGVLHRDLKPANLMIDARGRVKVLDFGLSKRSPTSLTTSGVRVKAAPVPAESDELPTEDDGPPEPRGLALDATASPEIGHDATTPAPANAAIDDAVTAYGVRMGTPGYAALELLDGEDADLRSDVFALGVVLYRMIAGELPFPQRTWGELRGAMAAGTYRAASTIAGPAAARLDRVLARALDGDRARRHESVAELVNDARAAVAAARSTPRRPVLVATGVGALLVVGVVGWRWNAGRGERRPPPQPSWGSSASSAASATPPTAKPLADRAALRPLTHTGACAYAPTFIDERTIVYDLTADGTNDLYKIDRDGGEPVQLTAETTSEWRAAPGLAPGEVVYVVSDYANDRDYRLGVLDLAKPTVHRQVASVRAASVAAAGDAYYYAVADTAELRRVTGGRDERVLVFAPQEVPDALVADRQGKRLAYVAGNDGLPKLCVVELATSPASVRCVATEVDVSRPVFSPDGSALYVLGRRRLLRHDLATGRDDLVADNVYPLGGIAVSPSGDRIVYSDCHSQSPMFDVTSGEPKPLTKVITSESPRLSGDGLFAFVAPTATGDTVMVLAPDQPLRDIITDDPGRLSDLAFSGDGSQIAYTRRHPESSGIYVVGTAQAARPRQITDGMGDTAPLFFDDETILFTRPDADHTPRAYLVNLDGTDLRRQPGIAREPISVDRARGRVLAWSADHGALLWWDPRTGETTRGPTPKVRKFVARLSADARWIVYLTAEDGGEIWRAPIERADKPDKIAAFPQGVSTLDVAIGNDGRVVVDANVWLGELYTLPAGEHPF